MSSMASASCEKELKFDGSLASLKLCPGEFVLFQGDDIEDAKGNIGSPGRLLCTNIRLVWRSYSSSGGKVNKNVLGKMSLSIGYSTILQIASQSPNYIHHSQSQNAPLPNSTPLTEPIYILVLQSQSLETSKFEFSFSSLNRFSEYCFVGAVEVWRLYSNSLVYRELRIKSNILDIRTGTLDLLPFEKVYEKVVPVHNLSSSSGTTGVMFLTNVRIAWHASSNDTFNVSMPWSCILEIRTQKSKYGYALVIDTNESSEAYCLGFRIDPTERCKEIYGRMSKLCQVHKLAPVNGVFKEMLPDYMSVFDLKQTIDTNAASSSAPYNPYMVNEDLNVLSDMDDDASIKIQREELYVTEKVGGAIVYDDFLGVAIENIVATEDPEQIDENVIEKKVAGTKSLFCLQ